MVFVEGVRSKKVGRFTEFEYEGKQYKRVELVAKAFYEKQGLEVSWSEGAAYALASAAINSAITRRISSSFEVSSKTAYIGGDAKSGIELLGLDDLAIAYEENLQEFRKLSYGTYRLACEALHRLNTRSFVPSLSSEYMDESTLHEKLGTAPFIKVLETTESIVAKANEILTSLGENLEPQELLEHMNEHIAHQNKRKARVQNTQYSNFNEWSAAFGLRLIEILGPQHFHNGFAGLIDGGTVNMANFDLTIVDPQRKVIRFAEVKNSDGLTPFQTVYLEDWIGLPKNNRPEFEFCFVQPE